ncbi:hypothetical protein K437DRAFT_88485 [Tilletiaria anomala UBC 951]|uniref:Uncharacterized protein n=1 Tax=Tilletiaria anomala (strain ATCC 24038 / CBS 436.72 / UBC 951) TaxID=1037660 RepID=A0A066W2L7_TILAU|nr:uncharacterized protein K437DRAFT_88485 [Tilletiaria anomala UBC 951]KDN48217.1 hypothetical protein K437DRAFT_88485 [Tilletiaria anomala UBC 951]
MIKQLRQHGEHFRKRTEDRRGVTETWAASHCVTRQQCARALSRDATAKKPRWGSRHPVAGITTVSRRPIPLPLLGGEWLWLHSGFTALTALYAVPLRHGRWRAATAAVTHTSFRPRLVRKQRNEDSG